MEKIKQFNIYSVDYQQVTFSLGSSRNIKFTEYCLLYRFFDIEEAHAMVLYNIVKTAFASGNGFFGKVADAMEAYCKACHLDMACGFQIYK